MYFYNTTNLNCRKKCKSIGIVESNNRDFIVLPKYILTEKYQKSGIFKAKIWIFEEMPTAGFDANNNMDFLIFLHNTNNRKSIKNSFFVRDFYFFCKKKRFLKSIQKLCFFFFKNYAFLAKKHNFSNYGSAITC